MSQLISAYEHIAKFGGRNRGKADSFYNRASSYKRIAVTDTETRYEFRNDLLPKRAICPKCSYWLSQKQTKAVIKTLRRFGTVAYCPSVREVYNTDGEHLETVRCGAMFKSLESLFC